jgi:phosphopantothenoylcysteine synthetase/decarboxylase
MSKPKILFQLSGSIACYKACNVISKLVQNNFEVRVACTKSALNFIGLSTLEGLSGNSVFSDIYETGKQMDHINLSKWADLAILCPASANQINSLASGLASDVVGALFLAFDLSKKPYLLAPAMNQQMYKHPATQESLTKLKSWGLTILPTDDGHQACGDEGPGRLLDPDQIFEAILSSLKNLNSEGLSFEVKK